MKEKWNNIGNNEFTSGNNIEDIIKYYDNKYNLFNEIYLPDDIKINNDILLINYFEELILYCLSDKSSIKVSDISEDILNRIGEIFESASSIFSEDSISFKSILSEENIKEGYFKFKEDIKSILFDIKKDNNIFSLSLEELNNKLYNKGITFQNMDVLRYIIYRINKNSSNKPKILVFDNPKKRYNPFLIQADWEGLDTPTVSHYNLTLLNK